VEGSSGSVSKSVQMPEMPPEVARAGVFKNMWRVYLSELDQNEILDCEEAFIYGSFAPGQKGGAGVGKTKRGKGPKWMAVVDAQGVPLGGLRSIQ
jgi:hypothetical protein